MYFCVDAAADGGDAGTGDAIMYLSGSGNVGIGTTNPSQELDVIGSVNITGVLTATTFGNINAGIVTGTSFAGDGSALTGVIGIGSGFVVQDSQTVLLKFQK